jgi:DNA-binding CsgD family transcriptional regulator
VTGAADLTAREREVVGLIAAGLSNDEISRRLYVSRSTVKTHSARAMMKLGARDRAQLVVLAYQAGLAEALSVVGEHGVGAEQFRREVPGQRL